MIEIKLTKEQYEDLVKLVYLGNWMINAIRTDDKIEKYDIIEQYIYSFAKNANLENYIIFDNELNEFYPTREFELETDVDEYREEYNNEIFWDELIYRLSVRDFIKAYGEDVIKKMSLRDQIVKKSPFIEKYEKEFEKHGIENLEIKK
ncbi:MAG: hypothetical protein KKC53_03465 [Actinobacteria bacterium]|nr:hypothetical protein [Actinomycetota bacterium]